MINTFCCVSCFYDWYPTVLTVEIWQLDITFLSANSVNSCQTGFLCGKLVTVFLIAIQNEMTRIGYHGYLVQ